MNSLNHLHTLIKSLSNYERKAVISLLDRYSSQRRYRELFDRLSRAKHGAYIAFDFSPTKEYLYVNYSKLESIVLASMIMLRNGFMATRRTPTARASILMLLLQAETLLERNEVAYAVEQLKLAKAKADESNFPELGRVAVQQLNYLGLRPPKTTSRKESQVPASPKLEASTQQKVRVQILQLWSLPVGEGSQAGGELCVQLTKNLLLLERRSCLTNQLIQLQLAKALGCLRHGISKEDNLKQAVSLLSDLAPSKASPLLLRFFTECYDSPATLGKEMLLTMLLPIWYYRYPTFFLLLVMEQCRLGQIEDAISNLKSFTTKKPELGMAVARLLILCLEHQENHEELAKRKSAYTKRLYRIKKHANYSQYLKWEKRIMKAWHSSTIHVNKIIKRTKPINYELDHQVYSRETRKLSCR